MRRSLVHVRAAVVAVVLAMLWATARGDYQHTRWQGPAGQPADWFDASNWTAGVPTGEFGGRSYIDNGGTAAIADGTAATWGLAVGENYRGGVEQTGGSLDVQHLIVGQEPGAWGTYRLTGGHVGGYLLHASVGVRGTGQFEHLGGSADYFHLYVGHSATSHDERGVGTYLLAGGEMDVYCAFVGLRGDGLLRHTAGTHTVGNLKIGGNAPEGAGTYELSDAGRLVSRYALVGWAGTGRFVQTGGEHSAGFLEIRPTGRYEYTGGELEIRDGLRLEGELDLMGTGRTVSATNAILDFTQALPANAGRAALDVRGDSLVLYAPGRHPASAFGQFGNEGITHEVGRPLWIGRGRAVRGRGVIDDYVWLMGDLIATDATNGRIDLPGGLFVGPGAVARLGEGKLHVSGRTSAVWRGELSASEITVGDAGCGRFIQHGGRVSVRTELTVGAAEPPADETAGPLPSSAYLLTGGELAARHVGVRGAAPSRLVQMGGHIEPDISLWVMGDGAGYTMLGGSLTVPILAVGLDRRGDTGPGRITVLGRRAEINVSRHVIFGSQASFYAARGSAVHVTGPGEEPDWGWGGAGAGADAYATFDILGTDPVALYGLGNLKLVFEGGEEYLATLEVAGKDVGPGWRGLLRNFALDTLQIGGADVAAVQLVNNRANQTQDDYQPWTAEALYVRTLILNEGSTLDLNGLPIYYRRLIDRGGQIIDSAAEVPAIPEPTTLALTALAGPLLLLRRRRRRLRR